MHKADYWRMLQDNHIQSVNLEKLAKQYGTPLYVYDGDMIKNTLSAYLNHPKKPYIHYAVKANSNLSLLSYMTQWGAGFDIVSLGELRRVLKAGGEPKSIVFSGVAKTDEEIQEALKIGIGCFNVESESELYRLSVLATDLKITAPIAFRVNPDVDAKTHPYISTGMKDNKFGIALENAEQLYHTASKLSGINIIGIGCHIGSQITTLDPFIKAFRSLKLLADKLSSQGISIKHIDIGGGLGIQMQLEQQVPSPIELVDALYQEMGEASYALHLQPGRSIVGNSGLLLSRVIRIKKQSEKTFIMLDAAMNDYIRTALYQAVPQMRNLSQPNLTNNQADIVGPVCETGDTFAKNINLFAEEGDLIALAGVGAYGMSMSSQYNSRLRPAEIFIHQNKAKLIRKRDVFEQLWENEIV